jgi:hypothetical protein
VVNNAATAVQTRGKRPGMPPRRCFCALHA